MFLGALLFLLGVLSVSLFAYLSRKIYLPVWVYHPFFPVLVMTVISLVLFKPLDKAVTLFFRNTLFKKRSYSHIALMNLAEELSLVLDLTELCNLVVNTFGEVLHLKNVALITPSLVRMDYEITSAFGWNVTDYRRVRLSEDSPLMQLVRSGGPHVIVRDRVLRTLAWQEANRLAHDFDSLRANWVIPLYVKRDLMGILAFSSARPHRTFDETDFHFFREFAVPVARCIRNALSVEELRMANNELQDVQSQLIQSTKITAIEQLATGIAHEIHNPLTIISGKAQVLLLKKGEKMMDEQVEEVLKTIVKQTKRAADITRKLLMFSQGSGMPREALRLGQVLEDTIALVSYQTSLDGIEITRSVGSGIPLFYGNVHEIREIFLNLILNAVQSIKSHGNIHIDLTAKPADELIEIQISDSGKGIDSENVSRVFDPFFSTQDEGVGLGLFVTKQITHRYGGSIRVDSRSGDGSLFTIQLPFTEPPVSSGGQGGQVSLALFPDDQEKHKRSKTW